MSTAQPSVSASELVARALLCKYCSPLLDPTQDCAARSLVPFMAGHVVAGLRALATARERKVEADAVRPSGASSKQAGTLAESDHGARDAQKAAL